METEAVSTATRRAMPIWLAVVLTGLPVVFSASLSHAALNPFKFVLRPFIHDLSGPSAAQEPADTGDPRQQALIQSIQQRPDDADLYYRVGRVYEALNRWDQAAKAYRNAVRLNPRWADAYYRLGLAYEHVGTFEFQGETYIDRKKLKQAIAEYRNAIRLDPTHLDARYQLSLAYQMRGQFSLAVAQCQAMLRVDPGCQRARQLVQALYEEYLDEQTTLARAQTLTQAERQ